MRELSPIVKFKIKCNFVFKVKTETPVRVAFFFLGLIMYVSTPSLSPLYEESCFHPLLTLISIHRHRHEHDANYYVGLT